MNMSGITPPFGEWLIKQIDREGWLGDLVKSAKADPQFPRRGSPDDVRKRLNEVQAPAEMFEAVDDAEGDWQSCC